MAFTHLRSAGGISINSYNFDRRVTTFAGGDKLDVMLLQALFRMAFYEFPEGEQDISFTPPVSSTGIIVIDGIVGPQTRAHINAFQKQLLQSGAPVILDGVIDPYPKVGAMTKNTKAKYQLDFLNVHCNNSAASADRRDVYRRMIDLDQHSEEDWGSKAASLRAALRLPRKFP